MTTTLTQTMNAGRTRIYAAALVLAAGLASGCGGGGPAADPGQARDALRAALDSWKAGEAPGDLGKRFPSILVKDADWHGGLRLVRYAAEGEGRLVGYDMNYPVALELKDRKGKTVKKTAVYTVTTRPECLVLRQEG